MDLMVSLGPVSNLLCSLLDPVVVLIVELRGNIEGKPTNQDGLIDGSWCTSYGRMKLNYLV